MSWIKDKFSTKTHNPIKEARDILKYIGPGLLVTAGFIDPGNWASNMAAGSGYGYKLLWMVTLSTFFASFIIQIGSPGTKFGTQTGKLSTPGTKIDTQNEQNGHKRQIFNEK